MTSGRLAARLLAALSIVSTALAVTPVAAAPPPRPSAAPPKPAIPRCADPCDCTGPEGPTRPVVEGRAVTRCLGRGRPVGLKRVKVAGDIDLAALTCTNLGTTRVSVPGVVNARSDLGLIGLERRTGQSVPGSRLVSAAVTIEDSEVAGRMLAPAQGTNTRAYCPVVFLQTVSLNGTTFQDEVRLRNARFRRPVTAVSAVFTQPVDLRNATFADNAIFNHARFVKIAARDAEFERIAAFRGIEVTDEAGFESAVFRDQASFDGVDEARRMRSMDFSEARFTKEARFEDAQFLDDTRFGRVRFDDAAWFTRARFLGAAHFDGAQFVGRATFTLSIFERLASDRARAVARRDRLAPLGSACGRWHRGPGRDRR
jgi:uncharacterized protein YjbI with pentapeptide repeats